MATDVRQHTVPAGSDAFDPQGADVAASLSINDIIIAANATDAANKVAAIGPTTTRPCAVWQTDTKTLKVYDGTGANPQVNPGGWIDLVRNPSYSGSMTTTNAALPGCSGSVYVPVGRTLEIDLNIPNVSPATGSGASLWLSAGGTVLTGARISTSSGIGIIVPVHLTDAVAGNGTTIAFGANGAAHSGSAAITADPLVSSPVVFRYRIV